MRDAGQNWFMSIGDLLKDAKGFDDMPFELQESFRTYELERKKELMEPRPNGGIIGDPSEVMNRPMNFHRLKDLEAPHRIECV